MSTNRTALYLFAFIISVAVGCSDSTSMSTPVPPTASSIFESETQANPISTPLPTRDVSEAITASPAPAIAPAKKAPVQVGTVPPTPSSAKSVRKNDAESALQPQVSADTRTFLEAVSARNHSVVAKQLSRGIDVNAAFVGGSGKNRGASAFHLAVANDDKPMLKLLVDGGGDISITAKDDQGGTALHLAVYMGKPAMIVSLFQLGIDMERVDTNGATAAQTIPSSQGNNTVKAQMEVYLGKTLRIADHERQRGPFPDQLSPKRMDRMPASPKIDPENPPRIATHNFTDLGPHKAITKLRAAYGHDYTVGDDEHDPTGRSCMSQKHYFEAYTFDQRWSGNFGAFNTKGNVKFYAPADGKLIDIRSNEVKADARNSAATEYQFHLYSDAYPDLVFGFHHVDLLEPLRNGGSVKAGQHLGYIIRENGQAEIVTWVMLSKGKLEFISFFDVMSDEVFAQYQARGVKSRAQMSITAEERAATPIPCYRSGSKNEKFIPVGDPKAFDVWQAGPDNWVSLTP